MHDIRPYLPRLFSDPGTLLYIGCRPDACSWLTELWQAGHTVDVLEAWEENAKGLSQDQRINIVLQGDVRDISIALPESKFDYIFWWHGPEHIPYTDIALTLHKLEARARRLVAVACPWGVYPQGAHKGNPYEVHQCSLYPADFAAWGYDVRTDGQADEAGSEIVAWRWLDG